MKGELFDMKSIKRGLALLLAVLMMIPSVSVSAETTGVSDPASQVEVNQVIEEAEEPEAEEAAGEVEEPVNEEVPGEDEESEDEDAPGEVAEESEDEEVVEPEEEENAENVGVPEREEAAGVAEANESETEDIDTEQVYFNTGSAKFSVVTNEAFEQGFGDCAYAEDGSFTINIPEANPFFPYEVQFTYNGETTEEWFMNPEDSVEIGGHKFYVSAYFDNTVVTQMSLNIAGDTVVVYPEKKEFTDGEGIMALSLMPLEERYLTVDLTGYTPIELTMVSANTLLGDTYANDPKKIVWELYEVDDDYQVSMTSDQLDLSQNTSSSYSTTWEMIVGTDDQLDSSNIRYRVSVEKTSSRDWLIPTVYAQDTMGNRTVISAVNSYYYDYNREHRSITINYGDIQNSNQVYVSLRINENIFPSTGFSDFKVFEGSFDNASEAQRQPEITQKLFGTEGLQTYYGYNEFTMVAYNSEGQICGCLPFEVDNYTSYEVSLNVYQGGEYVVDRYRTYHRGNNISETICTLYEGYAASSTYEAKISYNSFSGNESDAVTAVYVGEYNSISEAVGQANIKNQVFGEGYSADFSQGVWFTVFVGNDIDPEQQIYKLKLTVEEGDVPKPYYGLNFYLNGLVDNDGNDVECYIVSNGEDSYADGSYLTILVGSDVDCTRLAPKFSVYSNEKVYAEGNMGSPEISGRSYHDFSRGAVEYTITDAQGQNSKNYWLQIVKAESGTGKLYINSLADADSETRIENGITYSTREVILSYQGDKHDIFLANIGTEDINRISAELISDTLELDPYWTLKGVHELKGFTTTQVPNNVSYGELSNLARIRIVAKQNVVSGSEATGTLTIKSGDNTLMVLTLTGIVGSPYIVTEEIPQAVKFVPYGTMIQTSNKYSKNRVSFVLDSGSLPRGMELRPSGEIYGVPLETGTFRFGVRTRNSIKSLNSSNMSYTLTVLENTDTNVEAATDNGYMLTQRVQNISNSAANPESQMLVSQGEYAEFKALYLDGEKLTEGRDFTSEAGSTRIVILTQTLTEGKSEGTHTIGIEFRTQDTDELKRAAQNYRITSGTNHGGNSGGGSGSGNSNGNSNTGSGNSGNTIVNSENRYSAGQSNATTKQAVTQSVPYTIQSGDSLWKIAVKYYGNGNYWKKIFADNSDIIKDPNKIRVGQVLRINPLQSATSTAATEVKAGGTYTISSGDSLWKISKKAYGVGWRWMQIFNANRDKIKDANRLYVGQIIEIP